MNPRVLQLVYGFELAKFLIERSGKYCVVQTFVFASVKFWRKWFRKKKTGENANLRMEYFVCANWSDQFVTKAGTNTKC